MPTSAIELNKVALVLDPKKIGVYSIDKVIEMLRPEKAKPKPEPVSDAEKIAVEVSTSRGGGKGGGGRRGRGRKREGSFVRCMVEAYHTKCIMGCTVHE